jgi:hypothetical protein
MVPMNRSAGSEQNVQDSNKSTTESTHEGSECCEPQGKDEKEVDDDEWDDDWDAFQSLPATAANDAIDSGENSSASSYHRQIPPENTSHGIIDEITAGAMEGRTCSKELEEPSDLQYSSTEEQAHYEFEAASHEDHVELERHPTGDCKEPLAHIEMADELLQIHENTDQASEYLKGLSTEDELNNSSDISLTVDSKLVNNESREELSRSMSHDDGIPDSMPENVTSGSEVNEHA